MEGNDWDISSACKKFNISPGDKCIGVVSFRRLRTTDNDKTYLCIVETLKL